MDIFPWILSKIRTFYYLRFSEKSFQKRSFFDILKRKQLFLVQKIKVLTRAKKLTFFKGVSPWILSKNGTFSYWHFSLKAYNKRSFLDILCKEKKDLKRKKLKF